MGLRSFTFYEKFMQIAQSCEFYRVQKGQKLVTFSLFYHISPSFLIFWALYDNLNKLLSNVQTRHKIKVLLTPITLPQHYSGQSCQRSKFLEIDDTLFESLECQNCHFWTQKAHFWCEVTFFVNMKENEISLVFFDL